MSSRAWAIIATLLGVGLGVLATAWFLAVRSDGSTTAPHASHPIVVTSLTLLCGAWIFTVFANYLHKGRVDARIESPTLRWLLDLRRRRAGIDAGALYDLEGVVRRVVQEEQLRTAEFLQSNEPLVQQRDIYQAARARLAQAHAKAERRGNVSLFAGSMLACIGIVVLIVGLGDSPEGWPAVVRPLGFATLAEAAAFAFLNLYRGSLAEQRHYEDETTRVERRWADLLRAPFDVTVDRIADERLDEPTPADGRRFFHPTNDGGELRRASRDERSDAYARDRARGDPYRSGRAADFR